MNAPTRSFEQSVRDLADHPVVNDMAAELLTAPADSVAELLNADGLPNVVFIDLANAEFDRQTTGRSGGYLGSVAHAVLRRRTTLLAEMTAALLAPSPHEVSEAHAADLEARQAIRDFWNHGFPRCPLTRYADVAGDLADRLTRAA
ncbi:hypothetical protein ABT024_05110 [Streptomyces sp. NPDC002812]|uniref:hypothetical protein n=1 Tax=Streptomyces sp. NPDC002812 TaxID=3154434 RepID=UPI00331F8960